MFHPKFNFYVSVQKCIEKFMHVIGINPDILTYNSETPMNFSPTFQKYFNYKH